jgi:hypothetical protein
VTPEIRISSLICHRDVPMGLRCLESLAQSVAGARLVLHDDGTLTAADIENLEKALPVAEIVRRPRADEIIQEELRRYPACAGMRGENVLMLKLFDVALMGSDADIRYCDTDVLFFRGTSGLFERTESGPTSVFMRDSNHAYAARPWHLLGPQAMQLPRYVNSGLFMFRRDRFDLEFLEWLLSRDGIRAIFGHIASWAEQTCWAALGFRAGCGLWDQERIAVVNDRWRLSDRSVAAHFVSSSRHRLAEVFRQVSDTNPLDREPVTVPVTESRECSAFELGRSQLARRLRRACGF